MNPIARHGQEDVEGHILDVLADNYAMTTAEITVAVKRRLNLTPADVVRANKRNAESKIDQIIANALQDKRRLCRDKLIYRTSPGAFKISPIGLADRAEFKARVEKALPLLNALFSDTHDA